MKKTASIFALLFTLFYGCTKESPNTTTDNLNPKIPQVEIPIVSSKCSFDTNLIFDRTVRAGKNTLGYVRIRSNNSFEQSNLDNVIGTVKSGTILKAYLPEKFRDQVDGTIVSTRNPYYIIKVKNKDGHNCIGYVAGWTLG